MPPSYESLVQSLKINDNLSMEEVYTHIKDYCEANRRRHDTTKKEGRSEDVNTNGNSSLASVRVMKKSCFRCGSQKHLIRDCPKQEDGSESSTDSDQSEADDHKIEREKFNSRIRTKQKKSKRNKHITINN
jgi:hypothetical protein